jgi:hypothetical protein
VIDGTTQPGFAGSPLITIDGTNAGASDGLSINAGNSTLRGLAVSNHPVIFSSRAGIRILTNGANIIEGNFATANPNGVRLDNSSGNLIGGTTMAARNVFSGNGVALSEEMASFTDRAADYQAAPVRYTCSSKTWRGQVRGYSNACL